MTRAAAEELADRLSEKAPEGVEYAVGETEPKQMELGAVSSVTPFYAYRVVLR